MKSLEIDSLSEIPKGAECDWMLPEKERRIKLDKLCNAVIEGFVKVGLLEAESSKPDDNDDSSDESEMETDIDRPDDGTQSEEIESESELEQNSIIGDGVYEYARDLLSLGMLYLEYRDAIKEGDGSRVMQCLKFFLPLFKVSGKMNYSIEALQTIYNYNFVLSDMHALQWQYGRFVNT